MMKNLRANSLVVAILNAGLCLGMGVSPARAQSVPDDRKSMFSQAIEIADGLWDDVKAYFKPSGGAPLLSRQLIAQTDDDELSFPSLMDAAGYKVKAIETGISIVPYLSMTFGRARELSEADESHLGRLLRKHERARSGPVAHAERIIVHAVLDVQLMRGYSLDKVEVDLLPLPKVKFVAAPMDAPLSDEASRIIRAIEAVNPSKSPADRH